jgi:hypothetical protein
MWFDDAKQESPMEFGDLFSFDKKITPAIIKPLYWIGLLLIVLGGIISFFSGFFGLFDVFRLGLWTMVTTLIFVPVAVLSLRITVEVVLALFEIHEKTVGGSSTTM